MLLLVLPIKNLTDRYFMDKTATMKDMEPIIISFIGKKEAIMDHCRNVDYLDERSKKHIIKFWEKSFDIIEDRKKAKRQMGLKAE